MSRKGFTVAEMLVVMMILGLIGGAIMAFLPASAKLFQRGGAESQAERACAKAIQEMGPVVREALDLNVVVWDSGTGEVRLELSLPQKQTDPTTGEDLADRLLGARQVHVGNQHVRAFARQQDRGRTPVPNGGPGRLPSTHHQRYFAIDAASLRVLLGATSA